MACDNSSLEEIRERLENMFYNSCFCDLTFFGRIRINQVGSFIAEDQRINT